MGPMSLDMVFPALPTVGRDLQVSTSAVLLTVSVYLLGLTVGQVVGPLSDVLGRRRPLLLGIALFITASLVCALAPSVYVLGVARFAQGVAAAIGIVISRAIIRDLSTGADIARRYSTLFFVVAASAVVSPIVGTQVLRFTNWRGIFVVLFVIGVVLLALIALRLPESLPVASRRPGSFRAIGSGYRLLISDRRFLGYAIVVSCGGGTLTALVTDATFVVQDGFGATAQTFAYVFSIGALTVVCATLLNRRLLRTIDSRFLLLAGFAANAAASLALLLLGRFTLAAFIPCFIVVFASWGFISANATAVAVEEHARVAGSALALLGLMQYSTGVLAAVLVGVVGDGSGLSLAVVVTLFSLSGLAVTLYTVRRDRNRQAKSGRSTAEALHPMDDPRTAVMQLP